MTNAEALAQLEAWVTAYTGLVDSLTVAYVECEAAGCSPSSGGRTGPMHLGIARVPGGWRVFTTQGLEEIQLVGPLGLTIGDAVQAIAPDINDKISRLQTRALRWQRIAAAVKGL